MGRFDVYRNGGRNKASIPYLVDVQSSVISGLATRVVIPLRAVDRFSPVELPGDLFPLIQFNGVDLFLDTPQLGAIPAVELKSKAGSVHERQLEIQTALDRLFGAY